MVRGSAYTFLQGRHTEGQHANDKMFNITNYYGNANQNICLLSIPFLRVLNVDFFQIETYKDGEGIEPSSHSQLLSDKSHDNPNQKKENSSNGCDFRKS